MAEDQQLQEKILQGYKEDPELASIYDYIRNNIPMSIKDKQRKYLHCYQVNPESQLLLLEYDKRIVIPRDCCMCILQELHDAPTAGHPGIKKTLATVA